MDKKCTVDIEVLEQISGKYGTPYQIYDMDILKERCEKFIDAFKSAGFELKKNFMQYFAVKATPNKDILQFMHDFGFGFDCSNVNEIELAIVLNIAKDIIYTSNYTSTEDLMYVLKKIYYDKKLVLINLDDYDGLLNLEEAYNKLNLQEKLNIVIKNEICFRYNPSFGETDSETESNILGGENSKFGMSFERLLKSYKYARDHLGIKNFGIHVMTGSCVMDHTYWSKLMNHLMIVIKKIHTQLGIKIKFIDIGGGFGIPYKPDQEELDIYQVAKNIRTEIENAQLDWDIPLCTEAGRYITGPCGYLITKCVSIKEDNEQIYYGVDATMANLMRPGMYGSYHHITVLKSSSTTTQPSHVVGSLCENNDWFAKSRELPVSINKGDLFVIHDTGAHAHSMGFNYNGKFRAPEMSYLDGNYYVTRRRDNLDDDMRKYI